MFIPAKLTGKDRDVLSLETQESFTHFAQSLVMYLDVNSPEGLREFGIDSARDLVDLMSKVYHLHLMNPPLTIQTSLLATRLRSHLRRLVLLESPYHLYRP